MDHGLKSFNRDKTIYGSDIPPGPEKRQPRKPTSAQHELPFKPSSPPKTAQANMTIGKFPEYIELREKPVTRKHEEGEKKSSWKVTYREVTRQTPTVVGMKRNLNMSA
jgi:hypothetical protein